MGEVLMKHNNNDTYVRATSESKVLTAQPWWRNSRNACGGRTLQRIMVGPNLPRGIVSQSLIKGSRMGSRAPVFEKRGAWVACGRVLRDMRWSYDSHPGSCIAHKTREDRAEGGPLWCSTFLGNSHLIDFQHNSYVSIIPRQTCRPSWGSRG